jgi:SET domain-containing protein
MKIYPDMAIENINNNSVNFIVDNIDNTMIQKSDIHGYGLFATKSIDKGDVLCILDGQIVSWNSYNDIASTNPFDKFNDYLFMEWNALDYNVLMVRPFRTKYSFINHSRAPNLTLRRCPYPVVLLTLHSINAGEELTLDYRNEPLSEKYINEVTYL